MKISVIVPVYNAEKYLPACLESLLIQTFADFEVICVDDCSTDKSANVAENYLERFNGRLKIISLEHNTGSGAIPRNEGLRFSRGEYIFFMDADDLLIDDALDKLYCAAKKFRADVVCMSCGFTCNTDGKKILPADWDKAPPLDAPTLETNNLAERVEKMFATRYGWAPWIKFLRRDFLIANEIIFPELRISEDVLWTIELVCLAKRWLNFPERLYIYRKSDNSMMRSRRSAREEIIFWLNPLIKGVDFLGSFLDELKFFAQNPNYSFEVTNFFVKMQLAAMLAALDNVTPEELYEIVRAELAEDKHAILIANLFVFMNYYRDKNRR